ncbi:MAG: hypothetical protein ACP5GA_09240 [Acidithiobacillus sp.]
MRAQPADLDLVPAELFLELATEAGLAVPSGGPYPMTLRGELPVPYWNAGVLSFSAAALQTVIPRWLHWNDWLLKRWDRMGAANHFLEQISLSLTMLELRESWSSPGPAYNFPLHLYTEYRSRLQDVTPVILHYHREMDPDGYFIPHKYVGLESVLEDANARIARFWREQALRSALSPSQPRASYWQRLRLRLR